MKTWVVFLTGSVRIKCALEACMPFKHSKWHARFQSALDADRSRQEDNPRFSLFTQVIGWFFGQ